MRRLLLGTALAMSMGWGAHSQAVSGAGPWFIAYSWNWLRVLGPQERTMNPQD